MQTDVVDILEGIYASLSPPPFHSHLDVIEKGRQSCEILKKSSRVRKKADRPSASRSLFKRDNIYLLNKEMS